MKQHLLLNPAKIETHFFSEGKSKKPFICFSMLLMILFAGISTQNYGQGTWIPVATSAPDINGGGCLLLSDGSVICKSFSGGFDGIGNIYDKLTPDINGSYANGTWSTIAPMNNTRLYYSSQVLKDGRVYVAGGEYGTGGSRGEVYNPLTNTWINAPLPGQYLSDANSEILEDGRVLQASVYPSLRTTYIYNPATNTYTSGPTCIGLHNECSWVKLPDNSILMVDRDTRNSERYIPAMNKWIADATVPVNLYDVYGSETGPALLLADGRAFFIGSTGYTAYYTPSGTTANGSWVAGAVIPKKQGAPDAAAALMVDGKILAAGSPVPSFLGVFQTPTSYAVIDPTTDALTRIDAPGGGNTIEIPCYYTGMLCLPDGTILYGQQYSSNYYIFVPDGAAVANGKPVISTIYRNGGKVFTMTGTGFNGLTEGAYYGDDWQMATNYPIIRATMGSNVYYARTFNWNSTGVRRGTKKDTTQFTFPAGLPHGTYSVVVTANGIASDPVIVNYSPGPQSNITILNRYSSRQSNSVIAASDISIYPNPAKEKSTLYFKLQKTSHVNVEIYDMSGKKMQTLINDNMQQGEHIVQLNTSAFAAGTYNVRITTENGIENRKLVVQ
ncbi:MAG: T9SS type A sorting domain-containing protein [Parafilimonas sp.]